MLAPADCGSIYQLKEMRLVCVWLWLLQRSLLGLGMNMTMDMRGQTMHCGYGREEGGFACVLHRDTYQGFGAMTERRVCSPSEGWLNLENCT